MTGCIADGDSELNAIYAALFAAYGPRHWWPADSPFEVMVGAILTQNTAWTNVERALERLRGLVGLDADAILDLPTEQLADAIRPAGRLLQRGYLSGNEGYEQIRSDFELNSESFGLRTTSRRFFSIGHGAVSFPMVA